MNSLKNYYAKKRYFLIQKTWISNRGQFTVFVPSDSAFSKIPADILANISQDASTIQQVIDYHFTSSVYTL
jgi:uncharacterized surface protein with fasciclin (FAS1) repeats